MGNNNNVTIETIKRENLINTKSIKEIIQADYNKKNFFYDMLTFPEEGKIIVSTKNNLSIVEIEGLKLVKKLEIKNLKIIQHSHKKPKYKNGKVYYFYASKEETYASILLMSINFKDYSFEKKEIIKRNMPKYYFLNFYVLSTNLIIIGFNKGVITIFDEPDIYNVNNKENKEIKLPIEKEKQIFKFNNEIKLIEQQEECVGFFEVSDTCFISLSSIGSLRFYDYDTSKEQFIANNYMQGYWANPHSKNSIILVGNKLICAYKGITIIDVNKRLITQQIKSEYINEGIIYLKNETILLISDYTINDKNKNYKRNILLSQYIVTEEKLDEKGNKSLKEYNYSSGDLEGLSSNKTLTLISKKEFLQNEPNNITNCVEFLNKIIIFSSKEINVIE